MRTSERTGLPFGAVLGLGLLIGAGLGTGAQAQGTGVGSDEGPFASVSDAIRSGMREYNAGDKVAAVRALEYAAVQGDTLAQWKLGSMYADGDGVPHDDLRAFEYFSKIADQRADESPDSREAGAVASAFVSLGHYFLAGIDGTYVRADAGRAHDMFAYAATWFGDSDAQYELARLYAEGLGVEPNPRLAARWFHLAAQEGHVGARARLGHMLVIGDGVPRQRARGLMWLTLARDAADPTREEWVTALYDEAVSNTSSADRRDALQQLEQYLSVSR